MEPTAVARFIDRMVPAFEADDDNAASRTKEANHVRLLQEQFRAISRGDFAAFAALLDEDVEMEIVGPAGAPCVGRCRGRDAVAEAVKQNFAELEDQQPEVLSLVAQGDSVVVVGRERGRFKATGRPYEIHWTQVYTFRNGRVAKFLETFDSQGLLDAAGLR